MRLRNGRFDLTGETFGGSTVMGLACVRRRNFQYWYVKCECGKIFIISGTKLKKSKTCLCPKCRKEKRTKEYIHHGMSNTQLYARWASMLDNSKNNAGVSCVGSWSVFSAFQEWAEANGYKDGMVLERRNPFLSFSPSNCYFVEKNEQTKSKKRKYLALAREILKSVGDEIARSKKRNLVAKFLKRYYDDEWWSEFFKNIDLDISIEKEREKLEIGLKMYCRVLYLEYLLVLKDVEDFKFSGELQKVSFKLKTFLKDAKDGLEEFGWEDPIIDVDSFNAFLKDMV